MNTTLGTGGTGSAAAGTSPGGNGGSTTLIINGVSYSAAVLLLLLRFWTKMSKSSNLKQGIKSIIKRADVAVSYRGTNRMI